MSDQEPLVADGRGSSGDSTAPGEQTTFAEPEPERPEKDVRTENPREEEFVDGREDSPDSGEQSELVADTADNQQTLAGESADGRSLWEDD